MPTANYPTLKDRVVIITGGGQGLGRTYAHAFAAQGAIPVIAELHEENGARVVQEIEQQGGRALAVQTNVADEASVNSMAAAALWLGPSRRRPSYDIYLRRPFWELPLEEWQAAMDGNINGAFFCSRAVVPAMQEREWGRIINVASTTVPIGRPNYLHYITSKSAMIGMTRSMARELGNWKITVHLFMPGAVETEIERPSVKGPQFQAMAEQQCIQRSASMDEYAGFMLFLCSDAAEFTTGQTFAANGGIAFL